MKKVLIVAVCLVLVLTLAFTLGASGKKPPGKLEYVIDFTGDVKGMEVKCVTQGRYISSSSIDRPTLTLDSGKFGKYGDTYVGGVDGLYLDLSKQRGEITMQFFFLFKDPDKDKKEKIQLNVYGGTVLEGEGEGEWLSQSFTIIFDDADAEIAPTKGKGKKDPDRYENVNITIYCQGK